jgi:anti-sigma regulatory factor (Ser/Thr protein kinase)
LILSVKNDVSQLGLVAGACEDFGGRNGLSGKDIYEISLILEELLSNVIFYGYGQDETGAHSITVRMDLAGDLLQVEIEDGAKPFNPLEVKEPDVSLPLEEREIGGLGIFLVKNLAEKMEYTRQGDRNILKISKRVSREP